MASVTRCDSCKNDIPPTQPNFGNRQTTTVNVDFGNTKVPVCVRLNIDDTGNKINDLCPMCMHKIIYELANRTNLCFGWKDSRNQKDDNDW